MPYNAHANRANPYLSPGEVSAEGVVGIVGRLPWFCRIAFSWSCLVSVLAASPEIIRLATGSGIEWGGAAGLADGTLSMVFVRWGFCGLGLIANVMLLNGRRAGVWPAYAFLALGALLFALAIVSLRAGAIPWGSGTGGILPTIAAVALFAFVGGGSLGYYVLALHVFRNWVAQAGAAGEARPR